MCGTSVTPASMYEYESFIVLATTKFSIFTEVKLRHKGICSDKSRLAIRVLNYCKHI